MKKALVALTVLFMISGFWATSVMAIDYPTKPITIIIPWGAGGMSTLSTRMLGEKMKSILGQPVVFINKPGASGIIGLNAVKKSKPDGYTLASGALTLGLTAPYFFETDRFDVDDFDYIGSYMPQERVLFTTLDKPYKTWREFIAYSKKNPGKVSVGSGGAQWALEVMKSIAKKEGIKWKYVMFKSGGAASSAILGGHVDVCETGTGTPAYQSARQNKLRILVDLGAETVPFFPQVKNLKNYGYRFTTALEYGMALPKGVSEEIRAKLESALKTAMQDKELMAKMGKTGFTPRFVTGYGYRNIAIGAINDTPALQQFVKDVK
ncbi:MAG: tripartite tricarboxylate transporter substrate binding protein [Deltaproteobacteria bacterium]|jgi:tripartite-type tricarboxylate transporter receptor subunit TctC|nr:tripartite tricarboxylate transporter substrate binding protein [Deltaproteobacteria bacterium]MBT4088460.1 tripartite tricarboxylate transporter substrate binding protein [Deltaproteobacteria bacterium]MBT4263420.1 tripartite tricarboxylate transporter substrate binding protein [Deltaproteobacteria bacterium]MBT4638421.1 tripartite tricarboxylate transporter substrate binding protein [Deltaproteobacteria bacterium]MBT6502139.1 tripartite tricarboxylate transporter substrate binding protein 